jgi:hypothetical protein
MQTTTHRLIITGLAVLSLATITLTPAMGEARRSDYCEPALGMAVGGLPAARA